MKRETSIALGVGLVAAGGFGLWWALRQLGLLAVAGPRSLITNVSCLQSGRDVSVRADAKNVGNQAGWFKIQAIIVWPDCPEKGRTGYFYRSVRQGPSREQYQANWWQRILGWIGGDPNKGVYLADAQGVGFQQVGVGQTVRLQTPARSVPNPGTYDLYVNVAVSPDYRGKDYGYTRIYPNEHYWRGQVTIA